jgi:F-type H+-transporting ATPase subunit b
VYAVKFVAATPISISIPTLVIELLIFLGMVWLMEATVFGPIRRAWRERDEAIQAGLAASSSAQNEAEEARTEVQRILNDARRQAQSAIDDVTAEGDRLRAEYVEQATAEFQRLVNEARVQIQAEQAQAAAQLRDRIIDLALEAASQVTGRSYATAEVRQLAASVVSREGWS